MIGTLLSVEVQYLPLFFREGGAVIQYLLVGQGGGYNRADVEGLPRFALSRRRAEVAQCADGRMAYLDDNGLHLVLVCGVDQYLLPDPMKVILSNFTFHNT